MTKIILLLKITTLALMAFLINSIKSTTYALDISAKSYILYCPENNQVILEKNSTMKCPIASTTKIMTALLALETAKIYDECICITSEMVNVEGSSMGLKPGQNLPISSLAGGALTVSGNDAANAIAISLGGNAKDFAKLMNAKARNIGMHNTNFVTPSGLDAEGHYSTAYDLALLAAEAIKNKEFLKIVSSLKTNIKYKIPTKTITFYNENKLLKKYKGCLGIKTGFTKASGRCLVSCAQKENLTLIAVTLSAPDDWNDHIKLFNHGFNNFKSVIPKCQELYIPLANCENKFVKIVPKNTVRIVIKKTQNPNITQKINAPKIIYGSVAKSQELGNTSYFIDGKEYKNIALVAEKDYKVHKKNKSFLKGLLTKFKKVIINIFRKNS